MKLNCSTTIIIPSSISDQYLNQQKFKLKQQSFLFILRKFFFSKSQVRQQVLRHVLRVRPVGPCPGGQVPPPGVQAARPEAAEALLLNKQQLKKIHKPHVPSVPNKKCNKMGSKKFCLFIYWLFYFWTGSCPMVCSLNIGAWEILLGILFSTRRNRHFLGAVSAHVVRKLQTWKKICFPENTEHLKILKYLSISGKCVPGHVIMHTAKLPQPGHTMKGLFTALPGNGIWMGWILQTLMF